ncbi:MAG: hypothetical protein JWM30_3588 [Burkholderia sp.]|nr:hypothetical protein [Burkholderia sp.]
MEYTQLMPGRAFKPLHSLMYYTQRVITPRRLRKAVVRSLAGYLRVRYGMPEKNILADNTHEKSLATLHADGHVLLGTVLTPAQLRDIHHYLADRPLAPHGRSQPIFLAHEPPAGTRMAEYSLADTLACPHLLALANSAPLVRLAAHYIGCKPTISAIGLRWSYPQNGTGRGLQGFHRDCDDWRFVKVFVYLTDVDDAAGPHVYVSGTHQEHCSMRLQPYSDAEIARQYGESRIASVTGPAGTGFAVDTCGIHKGLVPTQKPRLLLQIQYSLLPVYMYRYEKPQRSAPAQLDRYINRLFVRQRKK